jgi:hypothetical protein
VRRTHFRRPSPALVVAIAALVVALAGTGYAALKLPKNSVGSKQIRKNAVTSKKVKNRTLLASDFKAGQLPAGPRGPQGVAGQNGQNGQDGKTGPQGPGAMPFDFQAPADGTFITVTDVNGINLFVDCDTGAGVAEIHLLPHQGHTLMGFGTKVNNTTRTELGAPTGPGFLISAPNSVELDATVASTAAPVKWTRFDLLLIRGMACNFHGLVIPS